MDRIRSYSAVTRAMAAAALAILAVAAGATSIASASTVVARDEFKDKVGTELQAHPLDIAPAGVGWTVELGDWVVKKDAAREISKAEEYPSSDYRALIDAGASDLSVSAVVKGAGGEQFYGVVGRYAGPIDWVMFFYDGVGDLVVGYKHSADTGWFHELGRVPFNWKRGKEHTLTLSFSGQGITALLDGAPVIQATSSVHIGETSVGIFLRGHGAAAFQLFEVTTP